MKISMFFKKLLVATMICVSGVAMVSAQNSDEEVMVENPKQPYVSNYKAGKISLGGSIGTNQLTHDGVGLALQFGVHFDYTILDDFKVGLRAMADTDFAAATISLDPMIYVKYYIPYSFLMFTPFVQAEAGANVVIGKNAHEKIRGGNFAIGASSGVSMKLGNVYIEPSIGYAYPSALNVTIAAGVSF